MSIGESEIAESFQTVEELEADALEELGELDQAVQALESGKWTGSISAGERDSKREQVSALRAILHPRFCALRGVARGTRWHGDQPRRRRAGQRERNREEMLEMVWRNHRSATHDGECNANNQRWQLDPHLG